MSSFLQEQHIDEIMGSDVMRAEYDIWRMQQEQEKIDYSKLTLAQARQIAEDREDARRQAERRNRLPFKGQKCRETMEFFTW